MSDMFMSVWMISSFFANENYVTKWQNFPQWIAKVLLRPYCVGWEGTHLWAILTYTTAHICNRPWQRVSHPSQDSSQFGSSTLASFDMHILCIIYEINNQILFGYFGCADIRSGTTHAFLMSVQSCPIVAVTSEATCFTVSANQ